MREKKKKEFYLLIIEALPAVVEKGEIINVPENWKNRRKDTLVITVPIKINGRLKYMSVVLEQNKSIQNSYYVHELITLEGEFLKKSSAKSLNKTSSSMRTDLTELTYSILTEAQNINGKNSKYMFAGESARQADLS